MSKLLYCVCFTHIHVSASLACIRSARTGVMDGCEQPYGCWESNSDPQQEMFLTPVQEVYFKLCACVFEHIQVCVSAVLLEARRGHQIPPAGVPGGCEPPDLCVGS